MAIPVEKLKKEYGDIFGGLLPSGAPVVESEFTTLAGMGSELDYIIDYWKGKGKEGVKWLKDFAFEHLTSDDVRGYIDRSKERGVELEKGRDEFSKELRRYLDRSESDAEKKSREYMERLLRDTEEYDRTFKDASLDDAIKSSLELASAGEVTDAERAEAARLAAVSTPSDTDIRALMDKVLDLSPSEKVKLDADYYSKYGTPLAETKEGAFPTYGSGVPDIVADVLKSDEGRLLAPMIYDEILTRGKEPSKLGIAEALFPAVPGAIGAAYGLGKGVVRRGSEVLEKFTGGPVGTMVSDAELAAARLATDSGAAWGRAGDDAARLAAGEFGFPVGARTAPDWVPEALKPTAEKLMTYLSRDMDVLSSTGRLRGKIPEEAFEAAWGRAAAGGLRGEEKLIEGLAGPTPDAVTFDRMWRDLRAELPDHDLSTIGKLEDYLTSLPKSSVFDPPIIGAKPATIYKRGEIPITDPFGDPVVIGGETLMTPSGVDAGLRRAMDEYGAAELAKIPTSYLGEEALRYGVGGALVGEVAAPFLGSAIGSALGEPAAEEFGFPVDDFSDMYIPSPSPSQGAFSYADIDPREPGLQVDYSGWYGPETRFTWIWPDGRSELITEEMSKDPTAWKRSPYFKGSLETRTPVKTFEEIEAEYAGPSMTYIDATGGPSTPFGGVGDIGGGSGTVTSPLTGVGGFYAPITPSPIDYWDPATAPPVDPLAEVWT